MDKRQWVKLSVLCIAGSYCAYSMAHVGRDTVHNIWIDASRPLSVKSPFGVVPIGDNAERGLWIGPYAGRGWTGEAGGQALYRFHVPSGGKYQMWAYCLWHDACTNAIYAQIDEMSKTIIGNDPIFNQWHWVRGFSVDLSEGTHMLRLSNHSDNIAVQTVLLTNGDQNRATAGAVSFADMFFDDFDGCDEGNFALWAQHGGKWSVRVQDATGDQGKNVLVGQSEDGALITLHREDWGECRIDVSVLPGVGKGASSAAGICFGLQSAEEYWQLRCRPDSEIGGAEALIVRRVLGRDRIVGRWHVAWAETEWHQLVIGLRSNRVSFEVDGEKPILIYAPGAVKGGIGLWVRGGSEVCFDDVRVRGFRSE